jgi:hypothetical protein
LNLVDGGDFIGRRAQAVRRDHGSVRASAARRSRECEHEARDQRHNQFCHGVLPGWAAGQIQPRNTHVRFKFKLPIVSTTNVG